MPQSTIVVTTIDYRRLENVLASESVQAIEPKSHLADLRARLKQAVIVDPAQMPDDVVMMHSTVWLQDVDTGGLEMYTLVYPNLADIAKGKLSVLAPVGAAVFGCRLGDVVQWNVPSGTRRLRIERTFGPRDGGDASATIGHPD